MRELVAIKFIKLMAEGLDPGRPPRMEWLPLASLRVDDTYQREITARSENHVRNIAAKFSWAKFSPLIVVASGEGNNIYAIIDGQHRATAALSLGYHRAPCSIVDATPELAAEIFAAINGDVTRMTAQALFKAARVAGAAWAGAVQRACDEAGVICCTYPVPSSKMKPLMTNAAATLRRIEARHGEKVLLRLLKLLASRGEAQTPGYLTSEVLRENLSHVLYDSEEKPKALPAPDLAARVSDLRQRNFSRNQVAAQLRIPYAEVDRLWGGA